MSGTRSLLCDALSRCESSDILEHMLVPRKRLMPVRRADNPIQEALPARLIQGVITAI